MDQNAQVITTGFHRSGTSMAMQVLKKAGLHIGDSLVGAEPSNPDGHFEDIETVSLHERWLEAAGTDWFCTTQPSSITSTDAAIGIEPIAKRLGATHAQWGLKDPRAALYLNEWFNVLENPYGVLVYRHYASCFSSIRRRQADALFADPSQAGALQNIFAWATPSIPLQSWLVHNQALIKHMKRFPDRCVLVSQEAQLDGANLAAIVQDNLPISLQVDVDTGVDAKKSTTQKTIAVHEPDWKITLEDTWEQLQALSHAPAEHVPSVLWDSAESVESRSVTNTSVSNASVSNASVNNGLANSKSVSNKVVQSDLVNNELALNKTVSSEDAINLAIERLKKGWDRIGVPGR